MRLWTAASSIPRRVRAHTQLRGFLKGSLEPLVCSPVQHECIPNALLGMDVICQAKSGMGKTAVFVLATLQQLNPSDHVSVVVLCNVRELAFQIGHEYTRFSKYLPEVKTAVLYGGVPVVRNEATLKQEKPSVVIATPGRLLDLIRRKSIDLSKVKHFVLDECDKMLEELGRFPGPAAAAAAGDTGSRCRHARAGPEHLHQHSEGQAGDDVLCHDGPHHPPRVPQVHERSACHSRTYIVETPVT